MGKKARVFRRTVNLFNGGCSLDVKEKVPDLGQQRCCGRFSGCRPVVCLNTQGMIELWTVLRLFRCASRGSSSSSPDVLVVGLLDICGRTATWEPALYDCVDFVNGPGTRGEIGTCSVRGFNAQVVSYAKTKS